MTDNQPNRVRPPGEPMPNARSFLESEYGHPDRTILIQQGGQFYRWDGTCWPAVEDPILRSELYQWFEEKVYVTDDGMRPFAPTVRKVADLLDATKAITIIPTRTPAPAWLGKADFPADEVIACENGLVRWPTWTLHKHRPDFYCHHSVPFDFDPKAPIPKRWLAFLNELWPGDTEFHFRSAGNVRLLRCRAIPDSRRCFCSSGRSAAVKGRLPAC